VTADDRGGAGAPAATTAGDTHYRGEQGSPGSAPSSGSVSIQQEAQTEQDGRTAWSTTTWSPPVHRTDRDWTGLTDITEHPTAEGKL